MDGHESELLVDLTTNSLFHDDLTNDSEYNVNTLKENLVQDSKKVGTPEQEGNINCAMDIFAPDQSSVSSSNSRMSSSSTLGRPNHSVSSEPKDTSDSDKVGPFKAMMGNNYITLRNEHEQADSTSLASDSSAGDTMSSLGRSLCSPSNMTPSNSGSLNRTTSPHFPSSNITFPSSSKSPSVNQWTSFGEDKENASPSSSTANKTKILPVRPPPAIPDRKSLRGSNTVARSSPITLPQSPVPAQSPSTDLLSMDTGDLMFHLSDASSPVPPPVLTKPAIPPRRSLFSTSSVASTSGSHTDDSDHDLIVPVQQPECHINHAHLSSDSNSSIPQIILGDIKSPAPPVPPRKNAPSVRLDLISPKVPSESIAISDFDPFAQAPDSTKSSFTQDVSSSSPTWVNFEESTPPEPKLDIPVLTSTEILSEPIDGHHVENKEFFLGELQAENAIMSDVDSIKDEVDSHWKKPSSSPDVRLSSIRKKRTGGIGYLSLENDCDNMGSMDNLDVNKPVGEGVTILLPENDMSPEKPQSQWATFQNEEDEEENQNNDLNLDNLSCGANSIGMNSSGFNGSINDMDGDLEDDFGLGINRLSTEMPDLKGFNRADKGSQNNLVDFSDDRGSAVISTGSHDDDGDDDVETIFDLTAQGDSLKRKRPKGAINTSEISGDIPDASFEPKISDSELSAAQTNVSFHFGPAGADDTVFMEEEDPFDPLGSIKSRHTPISSQSSRAGTPATGEVIGSAASYSKSSVSTNPFWSSTGTTGPSSTSQCSVDSPFDNIVFATPKSPDELSSKPSTPIRINPSSNPVTPSTLIRIPPPPTSGGRLSTRTRKLSQSSERVRNFSHGSTSSKKLDLDYNSDSSGKAERSETPIHFVIKDIPEKTHSPSPAPDEIFDPFSILGSSDPATTKSEDLFNWAESGHTDDNNDAEAEIFPEKKDDDITLVLDDLENVDNSQKNTNSNAHTHAEDVTNSDDDDNTTNPLDFTATKPDHDTTTPDPLLELKKAVSVESPLGVQVTKKVLPEIELVEPKSSWDVYMRFPPTKRTMSNRKWVPIHMKLVSDQVDNPLVKLYYTAKASEPFRTVSLASHQMQLSKPKLQAHYSDEGQVLGKLHAVKLMLIQYKEKQTFSPRRSLTRNASGFKHACRGKQSIKFGFSVHYDVISFCKAARDVMFNAHKRMPKSKDEEHTTTVKYHSRDEFLIDVQDELQAIVDVSGEMEACKVRTHIFASSFLSGDPMARITINDRKIEGKEVVRREDIIPTSMDGWIDIRDPELHESCTADSYGENGTDDIGTCTLYPPDACRFELLRCAASYVESELPVIVKSAITVKGARLQLRCILRMSGNNTANKDPLTQISCEDVMIRFPVPDEWGPFFRVDGRFRNHSVRAKRAAKQKRHPPAEAGVTMEASVGVAKYEKAYKAIVWRIPRLPEKNAVQNTPRVFTCQIELNSDRDLERLRTSENNTEMQEDGYKGSLDAKYKWCEVEYNMAGSTASNICVRSISLPNTDRAEKFVSYQSNYFYKAGISVTVEKVSAEGEEDPADFCSMQ